MNAKHTPGNWEAIGNLVRTPLTEGGFLVAECRDSNGQPHSDEAKRYALLIAAAPELLEALEAIDDAAVNDSGLDDDSPTWAAIRRARSAVEKATGASKPRFEQVFCSQCGGEFGPGDSGYSHCEDHRKATGA